MAAWTGAALLLLGACSHPSLQGNSAKKTAPSAATSLSTSATLDGALGLPAMDASPAIARLPAAVAAAATATTAKPGSAVLPACNCLPVSSTAALAANGKAPAGADESISRLLTYADKIRTMPAAELALEGTRLGDLAVPTEQLRLALVLGQSRQSTDWTRGQELVNKVLANSSADAQALHPLARLVGTRFSDHRRQDEAFEKQSQQLRDAQRRLEQTTERLEALKAIERSISNSGSGNVTGSSNRPAAAAGNRTAPLPPAARASAPRRPATTANP